MKVSSFILTFVLGAATGAAGYWYYSTHPRAQELFANARSETRDTGARVSERTSEVVHDVRDNFDTEKIKEELSHTGKVIRDKTAKAGEKLSQVTENARITGAIKSKLIADTGLSAFKIDVDTTDGVVTLSGSVSSADDIANAMRIAMDTDGVNRVVSTLSVKP